MGLKIVKRNAVFGNDTPGTARKTTRETALGTIRRTVGNEYGAATIVNKFVCSALGFCAICLPVVSVSPRPPVSSGRNMPMQMNLHCSRLLRIFA